jgi:high-affinity iron transporter
VYWAVVYLLMRRAQRPLAQRQAGRAA